MKRYVALRAAVILCLAVSSAATALAQPLAVDLPTEQRVRFRNPDGSCTFCSVGMLGVWNNVPGAENLLWQWEGHSANRGGAGPSRMAAACQVRGVPIYNITGDTMPWIEWALSTGRGCAGTFYSNHMVTFVGMTADRQRFAICDNNRPGEIQWFDRRTFWQCHSTGGRWVVVLDTPAPVPKPVYVNYWSRRR